MGTVIVWNYVIKRKTKCRKISKLFGINDSEPEQEWIQEWNYDLFLLLAYRIVRPVDPELKKAARRDWSKEEGYYIAKVDLLHFVSVLLSNCLERRENFHLSRYEGISQGLLENRQVEVPRTLSRLFMVQKNETTVARKLTSWDVPIFIFFSNKIQKY